MFNDFIQKYYLPPVGIEPRNRVFSSTHIIISSILFICLICIFYSVVRRKSQAYSKRVLTISALLMLALEIFRISWNSYYHGLSIDNFRFDFCNQICMVLPFFVFYQDTKLYPYIEVLAITGGFIVLVYPLWVFYDYAGFHLLALQSMVSHALMLLTGLTMPYASGYIPSAKKGTRDTLIGFSVILVVAFIMSHVTGENYLLVKGANGVPILQSIPFPYYWLVFLSVAVCAFYCINVLYHDLLCYSARIPLKGSQIYKDVPVSDDVHQLQKALLKLKFLRPFKYRHLKTEYQE